MTTNETSAGNAAPEGESVVRVSKDQAYDVSSIAILGGLEAVHERPGIYVGSTGEHGLHHCVYEVVDNSVDEALAGIYDHIEVTILAGGGLHVRDNDRGIPVNEHPTEHKPAVEVIMTILHAGGKFGNGGYTVPGGLHGIDISVVNTLSTRMETGVHRDGYVWCISFKNGVPTGPLEHGEQTDEYGTTQTFWVNPNTFETTHYDFETLRHRFRQMTFLNKDLRITLTDEQSTAAPEGDEVVGETGEGSPAPGCRNVSYMCSGGLLDYVEHLNATKKVEVAHPNVVYFGAEDRKKQIQCEVVMQYEVAMQWTSTYSEALSTFANTINTIEGNTHKESFRSTLTSVINKCTRDKGLLKDKDPGLPGDGIREGLTAIISVKLGNPQFEGQTKAKLGNIEARVFVQQRVYSHPTDWLDMHPNEAKDIICKTLQASAARAATHKAREATHRRSILESASMPGRLKDCTSRNLEECGIFIIEGDSTGGSAVNGCNPGRRAIMPIHGEILNVEKARLDHTLSSDTIRGLITAFGTGIGDGFDMAKLRYHKIVFMTDADVDGSHIATLLLTLVYRYMRPLIEGGHVYLAMPPPYRIKWMNTVHDYVSFDRERDKKLVEGKDKGFHPPREESQRIQRYRGLDEMNAEELWDTAMNPEARTLKQVSIDDAAATDETFPILVGEDVESRQGFIQCNAHDVQFLGI